MSVAWRCSSSDPSASLKPGIGRLSRGGGGGGGMKRVLQNFRGRGEFGKHGDIKMAYKISWCCRPERKLADNAVYDVDALERMYFNAKGVVILTIV